MTDMHEGGRGAVELRSPTSSDRWAMGSRHYIAWTTSPGARGKVEYSLDGGASWVAVADAVGDTMTSDVPCSQDNMGSVLWQVPPQLGTCRVRVSVTEEGGAERQGEAALSVIASQEVPDYQWEPVTLEAAFAPRDGAGALTFNGRMWLLGGWNPRDKVHFPRICNSEVWSSVDGRDWWLENPQAPWEGRHYAGYAVHRGRMWIVGGDANQHHYQNEVWSSPDGVHWDLVCPEVPWRDRAMHYTVAHHDRIWVIGGQTMPGFAPAPERFYNDVWSSADGIEWTQMTPAAPWEPRGLMGGSAVMGGRIWLMGGGTYDTPTTPSRQFRNDVWSSADGIEWTQVTPAAPWEPRQMHELAVFDDRLWVLEGWRHGNRNDVHYSADGVNWYEVPDTPWAPRHAASVCVHRGALWMVAGNNMTADVWKLTRRSGTGGT